MDASSIIGAIGALTFVLALIFGAAWIARRFRENGSILKPRRIGGRMKIVERIHLDGRHQAVLLRCDDTEHLVVLSPESATPLNQDSVPS